MFLYKKLLIQCLLVPVLSRLLMPVVQLPKPLLFLQFDCRFLLISCTCSNHFPLLLQYFSYGKNLNDTSKETRRRMTCCSLHCILNICNTQIPPYSKLVLTFVNVDMLPCCLVLLQIFQKVGVVSKQLLNNIQFYTE